MTNRERLRQMSDEELTERLCHTLETCYFCPGAPECMSCKGRAKRTCDVAQSRSGGRRMMIHTIKYNNLPEQCKSCQNLKIWALDKGENSDVSCKKGSWNFYTECDKYEAEEEE